MSLNLNANWYELRPNVSSWRWPRHAGSSIASARVAFSAGLERAGDKGICPPLAAPAHEFCHFAMPIMRAGENTVPRVGVGRMQQGGAAYAMAIESAALAIAACDLRLRPQLNEAFAEALQLRGGLVTGGTCIASEVMAVLDDVFARVIALYSEDLVPVREQVLRERAENLLRRILVDDGAESVLRWPFAGRAEHE